MLVQVLLFGPEAAAVGRERLTVELERGDLAELRAAVAAAAPALAASLPAARFAINGEFASADARVAASDEVALIGLVSGG